MGKSVGESLGIFVGKSVGRSVGKSVGKSLGKSLGKSGGASIGELVRGVGESVVREEIVGTAVVIVVSVDEVVGVADGERVGTTVGT